MKPVLVALLLSVAAAAFAHGGDDHDAPPPAVSRAVAPRAAAASEEFEAVVVLDGGKLRLYLDRFASNEPVAGARVEIEGAGLNGVATEESPGVYGLAAAALPVAKHPLTIAIETADSADLLSATLEIAAPPAGGVQAHGWSEWLVWLGAAVLAGGLWWAIRRRKKGIK